MRQRGDTAQMQGTEETLRRLAEVDAKLVRKSVKNMICSRIDFNQQNILTWRYWLDLFCFEKDLIMKHLEISQEVPEKAQEPAKQVDPIEREHEAC